MASDAPPRGRLNLALVTTLGLGAASVLAFYLYRRVPRKKRSKRRTDGPSLAEEIEAALALEEQELDDETLEQIKDEFQSATTWVGENGGSLSNSALLSFYGCYKQAMKGNVSTERPRGMEASMKWDSWAKLKGTSRAEAMRSYVNVLKEAIPSWTPESTDEVAPAGGSKGTGGTFGNSVSTMTQVVGDDEDVDETPVGKLNEMIHNGDVDGALEVLRASPNLAFTADKDGMTPMHWAADSGCCEVLRELVALLGSDAELARSRVNMQDEDGQTPFDFALVTENEEIAQILAEAGGRPNAEELPEDWKHMINES